MINFLAPLKVLFVGLFLFLFLFFIAPLKIIYIPSLEAVSIFGFSIFSFVCGCLFCKVLFKRAKGFGYRRNLSNNFIMLSSLLVVLGIVFRLYDRFMIRHIDFSVSSAVREQMLVEQGTNIFSIISSFLFPAALALFLYSFYSGVKSTFYRLFFLLMFLYPSIDVLMTGKRGLVLVTASLLLFYLIYMQKVKFKIKPLLLIFFGGCALLYLSYLVFLERITSYGFSLSYTALNSGYAFTMIPNENAVEVIDSGTIYSVMTFIYVNFSQYFLHGFFEWSYLYDNFSEYEHTYGVYTFKVFHKFFSVIGLADNIVSPMTVQPRFGVYTTFLGPLYVDFGGFVVLFTFFYGLLVEFLHEKAKRKLIYVPLYCYFLVTILFFPCVNLLQNALGGYIMISFTLLIIFSSFFKHKRVEV